MELVKVSIKNYRSIKEEEIIKINNSITTIIGLNESGKSSLLNGIEKLNGNMIEKKEKNKNKEYKNQESYVEGKFLIRKEEVETLNGANKVLLLPLEDIYVNISVKDKNNTRYYSLEKKDKNDKNVLIEIDINQIIKENLIKYISKVLEDKQIKLEEEAKNKIYEADRENLQSIYNNFITEYQSQDIYNELNEISEELIKDGWIKLIPNFKIIKFGNDDILKDEVNINSIKENIQVNNLLKIAQIDIDEMIENVQKDDDEEIKTYEGMYKDNITKMFKKIFRQNDSNFNFQIRIDTKNQTIHFYTFDNTSGNSPIPLKNRSDGFKWYFSIYITLYEYLQRKDNIKYILLFDEPNLYLNPSAQFDLLERVFKKEFCKDQIIYTTHNPYMIDTTNFSSIRIVEKTDCSRFYNTTVAYLKQHKNIKNEIDPMTPILTALNIDVSNNLVFDRKNKSIVVEGVKDVYILTAMIKKLNYEIKFEKIKFIPCFGAGKVSTMYGYLYGMGYDTYLLVDNDLDGINGINDIIGTEEKESVFYNNMMTYNRKIDKDKVVLLEDLFEEKDLESYLVPKNTVLYRDFLDKINEIELEKNTLDNFKKLFDYILQVIGG